ncbi:hypothetical protein [Hoeflea sp.]|uniref:hypothetical protein n=1 Tax=Hoeflea sp. TaxID=1940281 RepID=UPI003A8EC105
MSYYDHATMIACRLGPWAQQPHPPHDRPTTSRKASPTRKQAPGSCTPVRGWPGHLWQRIRARLLPHKPPVLPVHWS